MPRFGAKPPRAWRCPSVRCRNTGGSWWGGKAELQIWTNCLLIEMLVRGLVGEADYTNCGQEGFSGMVDNRGAGQGGQEPCGRQRKCEVICQRCASETVTFGSGGEQSSGMSKEGDSPALPPGHERKTSTGKLPGRRHSQDSQNLASVKRSRKGSAEVQFCR